MNFQLSLPCIRSRHYLCQSNCITSEQLCRTICGKRCYFFEGNTIQSKGEQKPWAIWRAIPCALGSKIAQVWGWGGLYLHTIAKNRSGDYTEKPAGISYSTLLKGVFGACVKNTSENFVPSGTASTAWELQMSHATLSAPKFQGSLIASDNFYLLPGLTHVVNNMKTAKVGTIGTVRLTIFDAKIWDAIKNTMRRWEDWETRKEVHGAVLEKTSYVKQQKCKTMLFFANGLRETRREATIVRGHFTWLHVHGHVQMKSRKGTESMHRMAFEAPLMLISDKHFMNRVDRLDQLRERLVTERRKLLVLMYIYTLLLDTIVINSYALYETLPLVGPSLLPRYKLKQQIAEALTTPCILWNIDFSTFSAWTRSMPRHGQLFSRSSAPIKIFAQMYPSTVTPD